MFAEQRKHQRVSYNAGVDILVITIQRTLYKGLIKNISLGGLAVETEAAIGIGDECKFSFLLPSKKNIKAVGHIVWEYKDKNSYFYGVQFSKIGFISKFILKHFIENKLEEEEKTAIKH
ncbi:MAG: hypothetical protein A2539_01670 [Elusimicrobia bacterium RIFOXYD2_FULL_34_15]|nr:MAG: hypothetical protein A2539_01670 [Elusimicrobia bacterium RIFOXYD2_FULL_34_15]